MENWCWICFEVSESITRFISKVFSWTLGDDEVKTQLWATWHSTVLPRKTSHGKIQFTGLIPSSDPQSELNDSLRAFSGRLNSPLAKSPCVLFDSRGREERAIITFSNSLLCSWSGGNLRYSDAKRNLILKMYYVNCTEFPTSFLKKLYDLQKKLNNGKHYIKYYCEDVEISCHTLPRAMLPLTCHYLLSSQIGF